jgi:hypothetical protein
LLIPAGYGSLKVDALKHAAFLVEHRIIMYAWHLVIYVVFGILLLVLALALDQRMKAEAPTLSQLAIILATIWATLVIAAGLVANIGTEVVTTIYATNPAQAATVWLTLALLVNGLGGGNEVVGGLWLLLVSLAAHRAKQLPRLLNYLGIVISIADLPTTIPPLKELGSVFGLGLIAWLLGLGCELLRSRKTR